MSVFITGQQGRRTPRTGSRVNSFRNFWHSCSRASLLGVSVGLPPSADPGQARQGASFAGATPAAMARGDLSSSPRHKRKQMNMEFWVLCLGGFLSFRRPFRLFRERDRLVQMSITCDLLKAQRSGLSWVSCHSHADFHRLRIGVLLQSRP